MASRETETEWQRVLRHFPDSAAAVVSLAKSSDQFLDMCTELCAADMALEHVRTTSLPDQSERLAECEGWIDRLTTEMREALAVANVVPLQPRTPRARA
jgi:hypothetical protein